jgi:cysteinyl-tRNA synthetase
MQAFGLIEELPVSDTSDFDFELFKDKCYQVMNDDFNSPQLIAQLFEGAKFIQSVNAGTKKIDQSTKEKLSQLYQSFIFDVLGFLPNYEKGNKKLLDGLLNTIIEIRVKAKNDKDWATSDAIRDNLNALGIVLKDSKDGTSWELK